MTVKKRWVRAKTSNWVGFVSDVLSIRHHGPPVGQTPPQRRQSDDNGHQRHLRQNDQRELRAEQHPCGWRLPRPPGARQSWMWVGGGSHRDSGGRQDGRQRHHEFAAFRLYVSWLLNASWFPSKDVSDLFQTSNLPVTWIRSAQPWTTWTLPSGTSETSASSQWRPRTRARSTPSRRTSPCVTTPATSCAPSTTRSWLPVWF